MIYKGVIDATTNPNYPAADAGWTYKISGPGKIGGALGKAVEVGDMIICSVDSSAAGNETTVGANWNIIQGNIDGAVTATGDFVANQLIVGGGANKTAKALAAGSVGKILRMFGDTPIPTWSDEIDTKNTVGSTTKTTTKLFLIGAESQDDNPVSYSNANVYIGTDNKLYSGSKVVLTDISTYVKNELGYATSNTTYALSAHQGYLLNRSLITGFTFSAASLTATRTSGDIVVSWPVF